MKRDFIIIAFLAVFVYADSFRVPFMWDDETMIEKNIAIRSFNIKTFFTKSFWKNFRATFAGELPLKPVSPIRLYSFTLDYKLWGPNPAGYHLTNLILHIISAFGVYILLFKLFNERILSFIASLIFVVHPVITETVVWLKNRIDILTMIFIIATLLLFIEWDRRRKIYYLIFSIFSFILALLSKETAVITGLLILLYFAMKDFDSLKFKGIVMSVKTTLPYWVITALFLLFQKFVVESDKIAVMTFKSFDHLWQHIVVVFETYAYYFYLLLLPLSLTSERFLHIPQKLTEPPVVLSILFILIVGFCIYFSIRYKNKILFFSVLWIMITLLPVSNIIYLSPRPIAEHRLYIPLLGFSVILSHLILNLRKTNIRYLFLSVIFILLSGYGFATMKRVYEWKDPITFWEITAKRSLPNYRTYLNLGLMYLASGQKDKGIEMFDKAKRICPDDPYILNAIGLAYFDSGKYNESKELFERAVLKWPNFDNALCNLGRVYAKIGRLDEAKRIFEMTKKINPSYSLAYIELGEIYRKEKKIELAAEEFEKGLYIENYPFELHKILIDMYEENKMYDKAISEYEKAIKINPLNVWAYNGMAIDYIYLGKYDKAKEIFEKASKIDPTNVVVRRNIKELEFLKATSKVDFEGYGKKN